MKRGELYRVKKPIARDPKNFRVFVVVSRDSLFDTSFSTVICAPIYSNSHGIATQVVVGVEEGLKHESSIYCDDLISVEKSKLTNFIGSLSEQKIKELNQALKIALEVEN
ncbi:MAG: type II toxin-antitoxin system PemK/MazF family toxin [Pyrinomonadaceae bacterium]